MSSLGCFAVWRAVLVLLAVILIPFALFGKPIAQWIDVFLESPPPSVLAGLAIALLLAVDFVLPIPSSLVNTAGGCLLGFLTGTIVALIGMSISCLAGYWLGSRYSYLAVGKLKHKDRLELLAILRRRFGDWMLVVSRPVPVLAEATVFFAGISGMPLCRFGTLTFLSNLGLAAVYAAAGAWASGAGSFLPAFVGAIALPGLALALTRGMARLDGPRTASADRSRRFSPSIDLTGGLVAQARHEEGEKND